MQQVIIKIHLTFWLLLPKSADYNLLATTEVTTSNIFIWFFGIQINFQFRLVPTPPTPKFSALTWGITPRNLPAPAHWNEQMVIGNIIVLLPFFQWDLHMSSSWWIVLMEKSKHLLSHINKQIINTFIHFLWSIWNVFHV